MFNPALEKSDLVLLLAVAAPGEADAIRKEFGKITPDNTNSADCWEIEPLAAGVEMVVTGVGKSQAAGAIGWAFDPDRHAGVLNIGIGGLLPGGPAGVDLGSVVLASRSIFADEGGQTPGGFQSIDAMGFPAAGFGEAGMPCEPAWRDALLFISDCSGWAATVSTCSGTDARARAIADRTGAIVENMEGAAVAAALSRLPIAARPGFAEIRIISNITGDRDKQRWDLPRALKRVGQVAHESADAIVRVLRSGSADGPGNIE